MNEENPPKEAQMKSDDENPGQELTVETAADFEHLKADPEKLKMDPDP